MASDDQTPPLSPLSLPSSPPPVVSPPSPPYEHCDVLEKILQYRFRDRKLLEEAMTHASYKYHGDDVAKNYERLEFTGDSILNSLITREMVASYPELPPGMLTKLRAVNVDNEKLGRVAMKHQLYRYLRHKVPTLETQVEEYKKAIIEHPDYSCGLIDTPKFLADIVESVIGAVSIDCNYCLDTVWRVFKVFLEPVIRLDTYKKDPTSELYEFCQEKGWELEVKDTWNVDTKITVTILGHYVGSARFANKKETAQKRASKDALDNLMASLSLQEFLDREKEAKEKEGREEKARKKEEMGKEANEKKKK